MPSPKTKPQVAEVRQSVEPYVDQCVALRPGDGIAINWLLLKLEYERLPKLLAKRHMTPGWNDPKRLEEIEQAYGHLNQYERFASIAHDWGDLRPGENTRAVFDHVDTVTERIATAVEKRFGLLGLCALGRALAPHLHEYFKPRMGELKAMGWKNQHALPFWEKMELQ